jgi:gliding motility-associated-like protein
VTGTSAAGCIGSSQIVLTVVPRNPVSVAPPKPICEGESVQLNATGGSSSYSWSPAGSLSNANIASPTAIPTETTTYTVVIRQGNCYVDTLSAKVVVSPAPTVDAGPDRTVIAGSSTQLLATATNATEYQWTPATTLSCATCASPYASPLETTSYTVEVKSGAGCSATDVVTLSVQCDNSQLFIPNTFTPNGDGANDVFYPRGKGIREVRSFRIYNRWGELLYMAENFMLNEEAKGWNGTFHNLPLKPDVYVWVLDAFCDTGAPMQRKGDVSIVK